MAATKPAAMTPGNRLYLYALLVEKIGIGNQVTIERAAEVLDEDGILPQDVGFDTVREMLESEHFNRLARVDVFKKGRVLLTVLPSPAMDEALALARRAEEAEAAEKAAKGVQPAKAKAAARGKGAGKQKVAKTGGDEAKGVVKPAKPGGMRRKRELKEAQAAAEAQARLEAAARAEAEARAAEERAEAERRAREEAERADAEKAAAEARAAEERAREEAERRAAEELAAERWAAHVLEEQRSRVTTPVAQLKVPALQVTYDPYEGMDDVILAARQAAGEEVTPPPAPSVEPAAPAPAPAVAPASMPVPVPEPVPPAPVVPVSAPASAPVAPPPASAPAPVAPMPAPTTPVPTVAPQSVCEPSQPASVPVPVTDRGRGDERQVPSEAVLADYPRSISREVFCPTALLSMLSRTLPLTVDVMALLDEDWEVSRTVGTVSGSRSRATFPLRYLREDGTRPVEVTLKRTVKTGSNVRWEMALIDGDDGHGDVHQAASLEGLPLADEGAWSDLGGMRGANAESPVRAFARFARIGTWDTMLGSLARMAAPERWSYPGTQILPSASGATRYPVLREYLAVTFQRARAQGELVQAPSGTFAAFNTGLVTASLDDIHACFEFAGNGMPWRFAGFAQAGSGELGGRITAELGRVPRAATYLENLCDVAPLPGSQVVLDFRALLGDCLGRLPRGCLRDALADMEGSCGMVDRMGDPSLTPTERMEAQTRLARFLSDTPVARRRLTRSLEDAAQSAFAAAARSYRVAVPVYDPATESMKLLLPLCLVDCSRADVALVVQRQPSGTWHGIGLTTLPRAYACARVVSAEQPRWLAPETVLA